MDIWMYVLAYEISATLLLLKAFLKAKSQQALEGRCWIELTMDDQRELERKEEWLRH